MGNGLVHTTNKPVAIVNPQPAKIDLAYKGNVQRRMIYASYVMNVPATWIVWTARRRVLKAIRLIGGSMVTNTIRVEAFPFTSANGESIDFGQVSDTQPFTLLDNINYATENLTLRIFRGDANPNVPYAIVVVYFEEV